MSKNLYFLKVKKKRQLTDKTDSNSKFGQVMLRSFLTSLMGALSVVLISCHSGGKLPLLNKNKSDTSDSVGNWSGANLQAARNQCMIDFVTTDKNAKAESVEAFCTCLSDKAAQRYKFSEYMHDLATFRDRQEQEGQMNECRTLAGMRSENFRTWMKPVVFNKDNDADETNPVSHATRSGLKIVVFGKIVNDSFSIFATLFDGKAWSMPKQIATTYGFRDPFIASNEKDQMVIVFSTASYDIAAPDQLWAIQYDPNIGFTQPFQVNKEDMRAKIRNFKAAMDFRGNIIVAWDDWMENSKDPQYGRMISVWRSFIVGKGWGQRFYEDMAYAPLVAVDKDNVIHTIFLRWDSKIRAAEGGFSTGSFDTETWDNDTPDPFQKKANQDVSDHALAVDTEGLVHYTVGLMDVSTNEPNGKLHTTIFSATKRAWTPLKPLSPNEKGLTSYHQLYSAPDGTMFAVWLQNETTRQLVWTARYEPKNGWQIPTPVDHDAATASQFPRLAVNNKGQALALWIKKIPNTEDSWVLWGSYYNGFYWQKETKISDDSHGLKAWGPYGIMMEDGSAQAFWQQGAPSGDEDGLFTAEFK